MGRGERQNCVTIWRVTNTRVSAAVLASAVLFATTGTSVALADAGGSAWSIGAARLVVGGGLLALVEVVLRSRRTVNSGGTRVGEVRGVGRAVRAATRRPGVVGALVTLGALGVLAYQPCFFAGTHANGIAIGTVLALGSAPVFTGILAILAGQSRPDRIWLLATAAALLGVVLLSGVLSHSRGEVRLTIGGVAASLGAGLSYAVYTIAAKALLERGWTSGQTMGWFFGLAAAAAVPVLAGLGGGWVATPRGLALALWLGIGTTTAAYLLFGWGLARLPARTVATLTLAEPLCASLLGIAVLGERLDGTSLAGMAALGLGLVLLATKGR